MTRTEQISRLVNQFSPLVRKVGEIDEDQYVVLEESGDVVACVKFVKVSWYQAEISHLVVQPGYRRQGYGRRAVAAACEKAKEAGARLAQCTIRDDNTASAMLFSSEGFRCTAQGFIGPSGKELQVWQKAL